MIVPFIKKPNPSEDLLTMTLWLTNLTTWYIVFFLWLFYKTILGIFRHCQVKGCATYHNQSAGFYTFPEETERRKQWSEACKIPVPDPKKKIKICWRHFEKSNFCNNIDEKDWEEGSNFGFGRLRQGTIPSQNLPEDPGSMTLVLTLFWAGSMFRHQNNFDIMSDS